MIVVKVGGSLFDHPRLGPGLRAYLDSLAPAEVMLIPGGGDVADAVRKLDRIHGLGEEVVHWLALRALGVTAEVLHSLAFGSRLTGDSLVSREPKASAHGTLDCYQFAKEDETRPGALPHSWDVTSDSIAARAAVVYEAERLVLLKSVDVPVGTPWEVAAERGWVDRHFPRVAAELNCPVEVVNFRRVLDSLGHAEFLDDPGGRVGG